MVILKDFFNAKFRECFFSNYIASVADIKQNGRLCVHFYLHESFYMININFKLLSMIKVLASLW